MPKMYSRQQSIILLLLILKLKLILVYHYEELCALSLEQSMLSAYTNSNTKSWLTQLVFLDWNWKWFSFRCLLCFCQQRDL